MRKRLLTLGLISVLSFSFIVPPPTGVITTYADEYDLGGEEEEEMEDFSGDDEDIFDDEDEEEEENEPSGDDYDNDDEEEESSTEDSSDETDPTPTPTPTPTPVPTEKVLTPSYKGIKNNDVRRSNVTIILSNLMTAYKVSLDGADITSSVRNQKVTISREGNHVLRMENFKKGSSTACKTTTCKFTIDKTAPTVDGVANGKTYTSGLNIIGRDALTGLKSVKLDGKTVKITTSNNVKSFETNVTAGGSHTLVATDMAGNSVTIKFTIKNSDTLPKVKATCNGKTIQTNANCSSGVKFYVYKGKSNISSATLYRKTSSGKSKIKSLKVGRTYTVSDDGTYYVISKNALKQTLTFTFCVDKTKPKMYGVSNNKVFTAIPDTGKKNIKVTDTISGLKSIKIDGVPVNFKIGASGVTVNLVTFLTAESKKKVNHTVEAIDCTNNKITYKFIIDSYLPNITVENKNGNEISNGGWTNSRVYVVANDKYLYGTNAKGEKVYKTASGIKCITIDNIKVSNGGGLKELKEGKHTIRAYDNAGNKRAFTFNYDSKMPSFSSVKNGGFYDSLKFSTKDYGSGLASVLILKNTNDKTKGTSGALNDDGVYTNTFNSAGCYKIIATDKAGNRREVTFTIR